MSVGGREQQAPVVSPVPPGRPAATWIRPAGLVVLVAAVLFFCYWRQSQSSPLPSDGSGNVLQAWAMLHGNLLLRHWWVSDVSFYTTELPQYALIEALLGMGPWVVHVGAAMTYTLLVVLAAVLAKGRTTGRAGWARALLAGGLMLSPQLSATSVLLLSPDHTGTGVPLLVAWLLIDRLRPRWYVPALVFAVFAWTMVADSVILLTGIVPLVLVCAVRAVPRLAVPRLADRERPAPRWYEPSLAGAAALAGVAGELAPRVIKALGGYQEWHVGTGMDLSQLPHGAWMTFQAVLELFGANVFAAGNYGSRPAIEVVFVAAHLAGAGFVIGSLVLAATRFLTFGELIVPAFAAAIVVNVVAYMLSPHAQDLLGSREIAGVLPLGAVLAGRVLGERTGERVRSAARAARAARAAQAARRSAASALAAGLLAAVAAFGYLGALGYGAAQAAVPPANQALASWLTAHRLGDGLATYWQSNSVTVDTSGRVVVSAVRISPQGTLVPYQWETNDAGYDPSQHDANFVVADGYDALAGLQAAAIRTFGRPARTYRASGYLIMVWPRNLLASLK